MEIKESRLTSALELDGKKSLAQSACFLLRVSFYKTYFIDKPLASLKPPSMSAIPQKYPYT